MSLKRIVLGMAVAAVLASPAAAATIPAVSRTTTSGLAACGVSSKRPASSRANLAAILDKTRAAGVPVLLAGLPAPGNYGPDFKQDFEAMYADLATEYDAVLVPDFLGPIGEKATQGLSLSDLMQDDRIHPNAEGVRQIVEAIGPEVEVLLERARADS